EELVLALIRGDLEVNTIKLGNLLGREVRTLTHGEAEAHGLVAGYAGPVGLRLAAPVRLVADDSLLAAGGGGAGGRQAGGQRAAGTLVAGANRAEYHLGGVRYGRDYTAEIVGDFAEARAGHRCQHCGSQLEERRGIEAGNTFKLGTLYSAAMGATWTDEGGAS